MDFVAKLEQIDEDFGVLREKFGINIGKMPHRKKTGAGKNYREHYSDQSRRIVAQLYAEDIERFDYDY